MIITSDKSYKNLEIKRGYHEEDLLGGKDPYSASKASAELIIQSYIQSFYKTKNNKFLLSHEQEMLLVAAIGLGTD